MIRILTLFVGLVTGVQSVDLAVSDRVDRVELRIGGEVVASRTAPPWRLRVDFGRSPSPEELVAVAFDDAGHELGRDSSWINVPTARAEVTILPERDEHGRVTAARIEWASPEFERPRRLRARVDDQRVRVDDERRVDLSAFDPGRPHVLEVEVRFTRDVEARSELVFGGEFGGSHDSGLTAAPVVSLDDAGLPGVEQLQGWFAGPDGRPLRVAAVELPPATLVIVPHPGVRERLEDLRRELDQREREHRRGRAPAASDLPGADALFVLLPEPVVMSGDGHVPSLLFPVNEAPLAGDEGLLAAALAPDRSSMIVSDLRLANAVAAAGMRAARGNDRRAVLLLLGPEQPDASTLTAAAARRFLRDLRVPLVVWDLSGERPPQPGWGAADEVDDVDGLDDAARALRYLMHQQRIVWLNGRHLPQDVVLTAAARDVILARAK